MLQILKPHYRHQEEKAPVICQNWGAKSMTSNFSYFPMCVYNTIWLPKSTWFVALGVNVNLVSTETSSSPEREFSTIWSTTLCVLEKLVLNTYVLWLLGYAGAVDHNCYFWLVYLHWSHVYICCIYSVQNMAFQPEPKFEKGL